MKIAHANTLVLLYVDTLTLTNLIIYTCTQRRTIPQGLLDGQVVQLIFIIVLHGVLIYISVNLQLN